MRIFKYRITALALVVATTAGFGCATLFGGGSTQNIPVNVTPAGAKITVKDASGAVVATGETPMVLNLKRASGIFGAQYKITISKDGFKDFDTTISSGTNGWYWGNLGLFLLGLWPGVIACGVDLASGSAYALSPEQLATTLDANGKSASIQDGSLYIILAEDIPTEVLNNAVPIAAR